jgi:hypothetical protein
MALWATLAFRVEILSSSYSVTYFLGLDQVPDVILLLLIEIRFVCHFDARESPDNCNIL